MRATLTDRISRRAATMAAALLAAAMFAAAMFPLLQAEDTPPPDGEPPNIFYGRGYEDFEGGMLKAFDSAGRVVAMTEVPSDEAERGVWHVEVDRDIAAEVKFELTIEERRYVTRLRPSESGIFVEIHMADFEDVTPEPEPAVESVDQGDEEAEINDPADVPLPETIDVQIIARRSPGGQVEFGMRGPDGAEMLPKQRYFPSSIDHHRWLRSTVIDFGDGYQGQIIARLSENGGIEFGFRVEGFDDIFPRRRFFPATGPDHHRWLRSNDIPIFPPN